MTRADPCARVIKVERPGGDDSRVHGPFLDGQSMYFARVNRDKQSFVLDPRDATDRDLLLRIVDRVGVLENYRPGVMDRLELGADTLTLRNLRLIYVSISGFGKPGRVGSGRHTTSSRRSAGMMSIAAPSYLATGVTPPRIGDAHYTIAPFDTFACVDRDIVICAANDFRFAGLCAALGRPELAAHQCFRTNDDRLWSRAEFTTEAAPRLRSRSAAEWLDIPHSAGIPCGPINEVAEAVFAGPRRHPDTRMRWSSGTE